MTFTITTARSSAAEMLATRLYEDLVSYPFASTKQKTLVSNKIAFLRRQASSKPARLRLALAGYKTVAEGISEHDYCPRWANAESMALLRRRHSWNAAFVEDADLFCTNCYFEAEYGPGRFTLFVRESALTAGPTAFRPRLGNKFGQEQDNRQAC